MSIFVCKYATTTAGAQCEEKKKFCLRVLHICSIYSLTFTFC